MTTNCIVINAFQCCVHELAEKRHTLEGLDKIVFPCGGPQPKTLIEVVGPPASGKSLLLWRLIARCLLHTSFSTKVRGIVFVDLSHKFSVDGLTKQIELVVRESSEQYTAEELDFQVNSCLSAVTVMRCYSPAEFDYVLEILEKMLWRRTDISLLAIDSLDEFYWMKTRVRPLRMRTHYTRNISRIKQICQRHNINCVYTVDSNYLAAKSFTQVKPKANADYELKLERDARCGLTKRSMNGATIFIDDAGINFA